MPGLHLRKHDKLDGIQSGRGHRSSYSRSRNVGCAVAWAARRWVLGNEGRTKDGNETWSAFDIVGHLIVGERTDWIAAKRGSYWRRAKHGYLIPSIVLLRQKKVRAKSLGQLLEEFARLRRENLAALQALSLQPEDLARRGVHPELGVVTLAQLLATWAVHDLTHVHQLSRVMAHQYRDAVGPWSAIWACCGVAGHSAP